MMSLIATGMPCSGPIGPALRAALVERARLREHMVAIEMDERFDLAVELRDAVETGAGILLGRNRAARDFRGSLGRGQCRQRVISQSRAPVRTRFILSPASRPKSIRPSSRCAQSSQPSQWWRGSRPLACCGFCAPPMSVVARIGDPRRRLLRRLPVVSDRARRSGERTVTPAPFTTRATQARRTGSS